MIARAWAAATALAVFLLLAPPAPAAPLEAYGRLPSIEMAAISPDGARLAFVVTDGERRFLLLAGTTDLHPYLRAPAGTKKVRAIQWAGPNHLIITSSHTTDIPGIVGPKEEWFSAIDFNVATQKIHVLLSGVPNTIDSVLAPPMIRIIDGRPFAFVEAFHFVGRSGHISLFKIDLEGDSSQLLEQGEAFDRGWLVDAGGEPLAHTQYRAAAKTWSLLLRRNGLWRTVKTVDALTGADSPELLGLGRDGHSALLRTGGDDLFPLREMAPDATDWGAPIFEAADPRPIHDPETGRMIGAYALTGDEDRYAFFDADDQKRWDAVVKAFPGDRVALISSSADHTKMVVDVDSPVHGPAVSFVDIGAGKARWLGPTYQGVGDDVSPVRAVRFEAADGLALTGYLTVPKGKAAAKLPLVVFPHGGPAARDQPGFNWWAQAMASRGYAVLQVNYRGSDGFGWKFLSGGFGQYGRKMQTDLSDGVRYLVGQGIVDPGRVCIVGGSYGGYAALAGVTLDPGVYRCAVSVAGISDERRMVEWAKDTSTVAAERYWSRYVGVDQGESFDDISPIRHIDKVTAPILLIHGTDDTVVPIEQSRMMAAALTKAGKSVQLVTLKSEDHWLTSGETRLEMLAATMDFLEKNNPPDAAKP
jgi:dipeptidyl aminopeptidase/acylaminoacyl peptidase